MSFRTKSVWSLLLFGLLANCRGLDKPGAESRDLNVEKRWYDPTGVEQNCDQPPASCPQYKDPKAFADSCVSQGFQAKSCGCLVVCSGPIKGFALLEVSTTKSTVAMNDCAAADQTVIKTVTKARKLGSSLDRCLGSYVCNGKVGLCAGSDLRTASRMREAANRGCAAMVLDSVCPDGYQDTFQCPDKSVQSLSQVWTELQGKNGAAKKCVRNLICSDRDSECDAETLKNAMSLKQAIDQPGCSYWLRAFCAIGSQAW
jgi:hypothetical protein